jgi:hypothetical protein
MEACHCPGAPANVKGQWQIDLPGALLQYESVGKVADRAFTLANKKARLQQPGCKSR